MEERRANWKEKRREEKRSFFGQSSEISRDDETKRLKGISIDVLSTIEL